METLETPQVEFKATDTNGTAQAELPPLPEYPELESGEKRDKTYTTDGALIGNKIYGEVPPTNNEEKSIEPNSKSTFTSKYEKQHLGVLEKIREHQAEIRRQKAEIAARQAVIEIEQILETPPPTAGEQLKETWGRLKALVKSIKIIDVQPIQPTQPSPIEMQLKAAKEKLDSLHTYVPKSPEEEREIDQIAREAVNPQLAAENKASDIARALETSISDANMDDAAVMNLVQDYMNNHSEITGDRKRLTQRAYERIVNKLAARRMLERNNPNLIKKISVEPTQPIIIPPATRQPETPIHIGPTHPEPTEQLLQRPKVNVDVAAKIVANRIQTDLPRNIETEKTRKYRELAYQNPEAVVGIPLPVLQETTDDMIQRNIDAVLINNPGIVDHQTRNAIEARVRETAQDRITLVNRTNAVAQRILQGINGRTDIATLNAAVDHYLADHIDDQNLNRNELVQRIHSLYALRPPQAGEITQAVAPAPGAPLPPDDRPPDNPETTRILSPREKELAQYEDVTNAIYDITYNTGNERSIHEINMYIDRYLRINNLTQDTHGNIILGDGTPIRREKLAQHLMKKFNGTGNKKGLWQVFKEAWGFKS